MLISSCFIYNSQASIDETALQNLNLVVNITKNIHIKSKGNDEVEVDEYAQYFPSFLWVVRDFALRIVDEDDQPMTARDYLENALKQQPGFSDQIESKNRIRRVISSCFKERDCCTLVRPLTDERDLQNLSNMEDFQLRAEFVEQSLALRKRILNKAKVKSLNGKPLNGSMLSSLLQSYVVSINEGAVPNIENAWTYICKAQCHNALNQAFTEFENLTASSLEVRWPTEPDVITGLYKENREIAVKTFKRLAVGDSKDVALEELENKMFEYYRRLLDDNEVEYCNQLKGFLADLNRQFDEKFKDNKPKEFIEYERELRQLQKTCNEVAPSGPNKEAFIAEFMLKKLSEGVYEHIDRVKGENTRAITELEKAKQRIERELSQARDDAHREKSRITSTINDLESSKNDLIVKLQCVTETLENIKSQKEQAERGLSEALSVERIAFRKQVQDLQAQLDELKKDNQDKDRQITIIKSSFDKDIALMTQKISFYESSGESILEKDRFHQEELSRVREEASNQIKQLTFDSRQTALQLENQVKALNQRLTDSLDDVRDLEACKQSLEAETKEKETLLRQRIAQLQEQVDSLENDKILTSRVRAEELESTSNTDLRSQLNTALTRISTLETDLRAKEDEVKLRCSKLEKDKALLDQQNQFLQRSLAEAKQANEEYKRNIENSIKFKDGASLVKPDATKFMEDMKEHHKREIANLRFELDTLKQKYSEEVGDLKAIKNDLEYQLDNAKAELGGEVSLLSEKLAILSTEKERWMAEALKAEETKSKMFKEFDDKDKLKTDNYEREIEEIRTRSKSELQELQQKLEDEFKRTKQMYEEEKSRLETKLKEEKDKQERKYSTMLEDYEQRLYKEQADHEEEKESLQQEYNEMSAQWEITFQHTEQELNTHRQKVDQFEKQISELKEELRNAQQKADIALDKAHRDFSEEKTHMSSKIESLKSEVTQKDKDIYTMQQSLDSIKSEMDRLKEKRDEKIEVLSEEKLKLAEKLEELTANYNKQTQEYMNYKIETSKTSALSQQQNGFNAKKIEELQKQVDEGNKKLEERIRIEKESHREDLDKMMALHREEKASIEEKYESKRRGFKELEVKYNKKVTDADREYSALSEKFKNAENDLKRLEKKYSNEVENLTTQITSLKETFEMERKSLKSEVERITQAHSELERNYAELEGEFDKDRTLWEHRQTYYEQKIVELKQESATHEENFNKIIEKLQETKESWNAESNQNAVMKVAEQQHQAQVSELNEKHRNTINDYKEKIQVLERDNRTLQEKLHSERGLKDQPLIKNLERQLMDLTNKEQGLNETVRQLKQERDQILMEHKFQLERERENFKKRILDLEEKNKEVEKSCSSTRIDLERERSKWNVEKENMLSNKQEMLETINRIQSKHDRLLVDNEKLKGDLKNAKRMLPAANLAGFSRPTGFANLNSSKFGGDKSFNKDG